MGLCGSANPEDNDKRKAEKARSKNLEQQMAESNQQEQQVNKLLLLGAGESGKSTLFKQMITIYGKGYPENERKTFTPIIYNNIITSMKTLLQHTSTFGEVSRNAMVSKQLLLTEVKGDEVIDVNLGAHINLLWCDPGVQRTFDQRSKFQLTDSAAYFFNKIDEVSQPNYLPTEQDVLRSRVRTTGIVENEFEIDGNKFKMFDVGGQRNERKKWIHCFENVTAVLFVAAISEYDQLLYEDENTNRMVEALNLFEEICNSRWFRETSMILFLNKRDLFETKITKVPLNECPAFADYNGPNDVNSSTEYIRNQFQSKNRQNQKTVYIHVTCATDTNNIQVVFRAVKDIVIRKSLGEAGLV
jgi:GTPase SAR1 family protein